MAPAALELLRTVTAPPAFSNERLAKGEQRFTDTLLRCFIDAEARSYISLGTPSPNSVECNWSGPADWESIIGIEDSSLTGGNATNVTPSVVGDAPQWKCGICLEDFNDSFMIRGLCGGDDCSDTFCSSCVAMHCLTTVRDSRFMVLPVRCPRPSCGRRVPTLKWECFVPAEDLEEYVGAAKAILTLRCPSCHSPKTLFQEALLLKELRMDKLKSIVPAASLQSDSKLQRAWARFRDGAASADEVLDVLLEVLSLDIVTFINEPLYDILSLIPDVERRTVLHLAALRRHPFILTPCCEAEICWKCKIAGHHDGMTCEEVQRADLDSSSSVQIQFCPGCNVATERTEGCDHMICLCGYEWTWENDRDEDDW